MNDVQNAVETDEKFGRGSVRRDSAERVKKRRKPIIGLRERAIRQPGPFDKSILVERGAVFLGPRIDSRASVPVRVSEDCRSLLKFHDIPRAGFQPASKRPFREVEQLRPVPHETTERVPVLLSWDVSPRLFLPTLFPVAPELVENRRNGNLLFPVLHFVHHFGQEGAIARPRGGSRKIPLDFGRGLWQIFSCRGG